MKYVLDTGFFIYSRQYYPDVFEGFWDKMNEAVTSEIISSVDEVREELETFGGEQEYLLNWIQDNKYIFSEPNMNEQDFIRQIFSIHDFKNLITHKETLKGKPQADPFVIAKAKINNATVVTTELLSKPDTHGNKHKFKIPDICEHFKISCVTPEEFMKKENWVFK